MRSSFEIFNSIRKEKKIIYRYMKIGAHLFNISYNIARERETEERHRAQIGIYRYKTRTIRITTIIRHTLFS